MRRTSAGCTPTTASTARWRPFETHYFHSPRQVRRLAARRPRARHGLARPRDRRDPRAKCMVEPGRTVTAEFTLEPLALPPGLARGLAQRRRARAHELRRHLPRHPRAARAPGRMPRTSTRLQPRRQQGAARPGHRLFPAASRSAPRRPRCCSRTARNSTPATGDTWGCWGSTITSCCPATPPMPTRRRRACIRPTPPWPTSRTSSRRWSATCTRSTTSRPIRCTTPT